MIFASTSMPLVYLAGVYMQKISALSESKWRRGKMLIYLMLTVLRLRTGYRTINPTKAGRDWPAGTQKRYNKSGYRSPDTRSLDAKSVL